MTQRTLALIKPDAVRNGNAEAILKMIRDDGFTILEQQQTTLNVEKVNIFYAEHKEKEFFPNLLNFMTSGPIYALLLQKENAIAAWRALMGPTDTTKAKETAPNSVRARFGTNGTMNASHGSDSPESAAREIAFFFPEVSLSLNLSGTEVRAYLESKIVPTLTQALTEMCLKTPSDPFTWLAQWLLEHHPDGPKTASVSQMLVSKLNVGDYFGEIALLTNKPRQATVKAVGHVVLLSLDRDSFTRLCGPLFTILKRNIDQYNMFGLPVVEQAQAAGQTVDLDEEEEEDQSIEPEAEPEPEPAEEIKAPVQGRGRRANVFVESLNMDTPWTAPVFPKTPEQIEIIQTHIRSNIMFNHLDDESRKVVINAMEQKTFKENENIITQGDQGDYWYLLSTGKAEVWVQKGDAPSIKVLDYGAGNTFGELALLHGDRRAATVKAVAGDVEVWALGQETFRRILMSSAQAEQGKREKFLENVSILATLTKYERFRMAEAMKVEQHADGAIIVREHENGDTFYIIEKGTVECIKTVMSI